MNDASTWRKQLAEKLAKHYIGVADVKAIIIGGSVSRGCADGYSDLEIGVLWKRPPDEAIRKSAIGAWKAFTAVFNGYRFSDDPLKEGAEESVYLGGDAAEGLKVDIYHKNVASIEGVLRDVIDEYDTAIEKQELVATIHNAIPLFGREYVTAWKDKTALYPQGLADAMVKEYLRFNPFFGPAMLMNRSGMFLELRRILISYEERIINTLMGLNHIYHRGDYKWLDSIVGQMHFTPSSLLVRMQKINESPPKESWNLIAELIDETCSLIEEHMPYVNTRSARAWFTVQRHIWDRSPVEAE